MNLSEIATKQDIEELKNWLFSLEEHIKDIDAQSNPYNKKILCLKEAASFLSISIGRLRVKMCRGEVPFYKPEGGKPYFLTEELERYMKSNKRYSHHEIVVEANTYILKKKLKDKKY